MDPIVEIASLNALEWQNGYLVDSTTDLIIDVSLDSEPSYMARRQLIDPNQICPLASKPYCHKKVYLIYRDTTGWEVVLFPKGDFMCDVHYDKDRLIVQAVDGSNTLGICHVGKLDLLRSIREGAITRCQLRYSKEFGMFECLK